MSTLLTGSAPARPVELAGATRVVAAVACVAAGLRVDLAKGITPGLLMLVLLLPVWWPQVRTSWPTRLLVSLTGLALAVGFVLAWAAHGTRGVDFRSGVVVAGLVVVSCAGLVLLMWARTVLSVLAVVGWFALGSLLYVLSTPGLLADNPWKFGLVRPVTVLVLLAVAAYARRSGRPHPLLVAVVLVALAVVGIALDSRSEAGFLALTLILVAWQAVVVGGGRRLRALSPALLIVAVAGGLYLGATQLFVSGALGTAIQERSTEQIDASGSLLLGGRPEWSATVELMGDRPWGYGFGVLADSHDIQLAERGFANINVDPATGSERYITNYMLADGFHLHSTAADLWAVAGFAGLALAAGVVVVVGGGLSTSLAVGRAEPMLVYLAIVVLWDIAFSPLFSSITDLTLGLFLATLAIEHARAVRAGDDPDPGGVTAAPPPAEAPGGPPPVLYGAARNPPADPERWTTT